MLYANPATARMLGLAHRRIVSSNVFRWVHDDDMLTFRTNFASGSSSRASVKSAFRLRHKDGTWRHIESVGVNRLDDPEHPRHHHQLPRRDRKQAGRPALREGEARYRQLTEQATDIIYNCDLEGRFTFVNPTAPRLMKYSEDELLGRHFLSLIRQDYRERAAEF